MCETTCGHFSCLFARFFDGWMEGEGRRGLGIGFDGGGCIFFFFPNVLCVYVANWYGAGCLE